MKTLVYTTAIGDDHVRMTQMMVQSLREFGKYEGDIMVFTEKPVSIDGAETKVELDMLALHVPHLSKVYMGKFMDTTGYDRIMYMDTDIVTIKPIQWLIDLPGTWLCPEMQVLQEIDKQAFSIASEPCEFGTMGMNSGMLIADAFDWNKLCQKWWDSCIITQCWKTGYCFDQPVINHLVRHESIEAGLLPPGTMHILHHYSSGFTDKTTFVHARAPLKWAIMRLVMDMART